jgi:hypothetical protein
MSHYTARSMCTGWQAQLGVSVKVVAVTANSAARPAASMTDVTRALNTAECSCKHVKPSIVVPFWLRVQQLSQCVAPGMNDAHPFA